MTNYEVLAKVFRNSNKEVLAVAIQNECSNLMGSLCDTFDVECRGCPFRSFASVSRWFDEEVEE